MYQLLFNGYPLYDSRDEDLYIRDPSFKFAVGEPGEASFTIDPDHPYADKITRLKGVLDLRARGVSIFKGRVVRDTRDFYLCRKIEAEGLLACLNDSVIPPFSFPDDFKDDPIYQEAAASGNVVKFFLEWLLSQHNSQVGEQQQIKLGDVTVRDPNNYISRASSEYGTTLSVIHNKLEKLMGGYLLPDYSGDITVLHYYDDLPLTNTQVVEYGENLRDLKSKIDSADTYTAILPVGKDNLTIANLSDGDLGSDLVKKGLVVYSKKAEENSGGRITRVVSFDDVTIESNLVRKASQTLTREGTRSNHAITVTAADLGLWAEEASASDISVAGESVTDTISMFRVGRYVRLQSTPHGFGATYPLLELEPNIQDPRNTLISMGAVTKSASDIAHSNQSSTQEQFDKQQQEIHKNEGNLNDLKQSVKEQITSAIKTCEGIIFSALERYVETSNFEQFKKEVSSQLSIMADEISMKFTETTEKIENVNGELQGKYESISKIIRATIDGIIIGASNSDTQLHLDNDLIEILVAGLAEVWIDKSGLTAEQATVKTLHIGDYTISAGSDGSLMLT